MWGECVFVDPIADVAVLGTPDNQGFDKEAEAYDAVVKATFPLPIGDLPLTSSPITLPSSFTETTRAGKEWITAPPCTILGPLEAEAEAWLLGLDGQWFRCQVRAGSRGLAILRAAETIAGGMSGSPIVLDNGTAIGLSSLTLAPRRHSCRVNYRPGSWPSLRRKNEHLKALHP